MDDGRDKFYVLATPRSRSNWLSRFLSTPTCTVDHEGSYKYSNVEDMNNRDNPDGIVDTGLSLLWDKLQGKILIVRRNPEDCLKSLILRAKKFNLVRSEDSLREELRIGNACLDAAEAYHPSIGFDDLQNESACKEIFEYLTCEPFDRDRWLNMKDVNLQSDWAEKKRQLENIDNSKLLYKDFLHE